MEAECREDSIKGRCLLSDCTRHIREVGTNKKTKGTMVGYDAVIISCRFIGAGHYSTTNNYDRLRAYQFYAPLSRAKKERLGGNHVATCDCNVARRQRTHC